MTFSSLDEANEAVVPGSSVEMIDLPCFVLLGLLGDDTLTVLCHWHEEPSEDEVDEMISTALDEYVTFYLSPVGKMINPKGS